MAKTYLATQAEVSAVEQKADTANTAINATDTGLAALNTATGELVTKTDSTDAKVATLEATVGDDTSGLVKAVNGLDTQINEAGTGIVARVEDLEQGGTTTIKFRTHSASGVYDDGEVVQKGGSLYRSNSSIDGSSTAIPFATGTTGATWAPVSLHNPEQDIVPDVKNVRFVGSDTKYYRGGWFEYINFMSDSEVSEGNIDADTGSLGVYGENELALGYGNNNKDMTFTSNGIALKQNMVVDVGKSIKFEDGDTTGKEHVRMEISGNDLVFRGHANGADSAVQPIKFTYQNKIESVNSTKVYSLYRSLVSATQTSTIVDDERIKITFSADNTENTNWFIITNKSGKPCHFIWSAIHKSSASSGKSIISDGSGLTVSSPDKGSAKTISIGITGRDESGLGEVGVCVDITMHATTGANNKAVATIKVSGIY